MNGTSVSLLERARHVTAEIAEVDALERASQHAGLVKTRATQLGDPADRLVVAAGWLRELRQRGVSVPVNATQATVLRHHVVEMRDRYAADPESLTAPDADMKFAFLEPLRRFPGDLEAAIRAAWAGWVAEQVPMPPSGLLETFEHVPTAATQVERIRQLTQRIEALSASLPKSDADFDEVARIGRVLRETLATFVGIPQDVQVFIRHALAGEARLAQFTPTVQAWLKEHGWEDAVRIQLRWARSSWSSISR